MVVVVPVVVAVVAAAETLDVGTWPQAVLRTHGSAQSTHIETAVARGEHVPTSQDRDAHSILTSRRIEELEDVEDEELEAEEDDEADEEATFDVDGLRK